MRKCDIIVVEYVKCPCEHKPILLDECMKCDVYGGIDTTGTVKCLNEW